jgi:hypothetical protein
MVSWKMKISILIFLIIAIIIVGITFLLINQIRWKESKSQIESRSEKIYVPSQISNTSQSQIFSSSSFKIGDVIKLNDFTLMVKGIKMTRWIVLDYVGKKRAFPSSESYKFVILFVILNNTGSKFESTMNIRNLTITTDKKHLYEAITPYEIFIKYENESREPTEEELREYYCEPYGPFGLVPPMKEVKGCFFFEIREDEEPMIFSFTFPSAEEKIFSIRLEKLTR